MRRLIAGAGLATLLGLTAIADAGPRWMDKRTDVEMRMQMPENYTCNTGSPTTLVVGVAALGLVLRRRR